MGNEYNTLTEFKSPEDRVASTSADSHNQLKQSLEEANLQIAQLSEQCASLTAKLDSFVSERQDMEQQLIEAHEVCSFKRIENGVHLLRSHSIEYIGKLLFPFPI